MDERILKWQKQKTPQKPQVILGSHIGIVRAMWHISAIITRIVDLQGSSFLFGPWIPDVKFTKVLLDEKSRNPTNFKANEQRSARRLHESHSPSTFSLT